MKYRKKPVVIEAKQFYDDAVSFIELRNFMNCELVISYKEPNNPKLQIATLEGVMEASVGDYIIQGVNGEFYPCKPDIFNKTYEAYLEPMFKKFSVADTSKPCDDMNISACNNNVVFGGRCGGGMSHHINMQKLSENDLECPICGKPLCIQETSGIAVCSDANCEYGHV